MTLVRARGAFLAIAALVLRAQSLHAQPLQSHLAHVLVTTTEDIDDIAVNPGDGRLLVLTHCTVSCGGIVEHLDHYTVDGVFVMRTPLTVSVNRILPVGSTIYLALASTDSAGGLFRLTGEEATPLPVSTPLDGMSPVNRVWKAGPDGAIYLLQNSIAARASVVMRITPEGVVSLVNTVPYTYADMEPAQDAVYVQASQTVYRVTPSDVTAIYTFSIYALTGAPIDGGDGFLYGGYSFDGFPGVYTLTPAGVTSRGSCFSLPGGVGGLVQVSSGQVDGFTTSGGVSNAGILFEILNGRCVQAYDFPASIGAPRKLIVNQDRAVYGASRRSVFRIYGTDHPPIGLLLYSQTTGDRLLATAVPGGSIGFDAVTWATGWHIFPADFNHDAQRDLLFYNPSSGLFVKGIGIGNGQFDYTVSYYWAPDWDIHVVDLNGDGQSDLFLYNPTTGRWFAAMTTGDGTGDFDYTRNGVWAHGWTFTPVDWDGDARTDLFAYNKASGVWVKVTTLADGSFDFPAWGSWAPGWDTYDADFDGDGRSELFLYASAGTPIVGRNFVVRAVGNTFEYTEGMRWGPNWTVTIADLDGDGRSDIFLYDPATGWWYEVFKDGAADSYYSGLWANNWRTALLHGGGDTGVLTTADALMVYNATTGMYFKVIPHERGGFDYLGGTWPTGMTLIPMR